ncbi:MAG: glycogen/starch synthase [Candidatus Nanohaloarchaea archaeon]
MAPDNLIEVSFEVSNKVGGIYQVLKSKAGKMKDYYGDNYITVGYYDEEGAREDFAPRKENPFEEVFEKLREEGIECHYGVWNIQDAPRCILVDASDLEKDVDEIKEFLWEEYGLDSLGAGQDFDDPVEWSYAVGRLVSELEKELSGQTAVHLHEWLSGGAMFQFDLPTVFTTHATVLGRALSNSDYDLRSAVMSGEVDDSKAEEYGVAPKHQMEKISARESDIFTTVSKTTGREASAVLGVKPDKILPNGFNVEEYPSLEELSYTHKKKKRKMKNFLQAYFEPYYDVDLESDPRILFTSGRYEFHNKGLDLLIDSLGELNRREGETFYVFIFVPADTAGGKKEVIENVSLFEELEDFVESKMPELRSAILNAITSGSDPAQRCFNIFDEEDGLESLQANFHAKGDRPPMSAFDLNYGEDQILEALHENGLKNREEDRVKVIFYPTYLSVGDRMLNMSYQDAMKACSAGIFPSYYEPWGYTPVETAANGALSVTTDLAGFGQFLLENTESGDRKGIRVLEREGVPDDEAKYQLAEMIEDIVDYSRTEITERKHNARRLAQLTSWEKLGENYREAHERAVKRK